MEIAAASIGVADISVRSISACYQAVVEWKNAPKRIESITRELELLKSSITNLAALQKTGESNARSIGERIGIPQAVGICNDRCAQLEPYLSKWATSPSKHRIRARLDYLLHRNDIESVLAEVQTAKITIILTVLITNLTATLQSQHMSQEQVRAEVAKAEKSTETILEENSLAKWKKVPDMSEYKNKASEEIKATEATVGNIQQEIDDVQDDGKKNMVGMGGPNIPKNLQSFQKVSKIKQGEKSQGSKIGVYYGEI